MLTMTLKRHFLQPSIGKMFLRMSFEVEGVFNGQYDDVLRIEMGELLFYLTVSNLTSVNGSITS